MLSLSLSNYPIYVLIYPVYTCTMYISTLVVVTPSAPLRVATLGDFFMKRVCFVIDGFNLYHSLNDIAVHNNGLCSKWLDVRALCTSYLHVIGSGAQLEKIFYFTAVAYFRNDPNLILRHENYIKCLEDCGR